MTTAYIILERATIDGHDGTLWKQVATTDAHSAEHAVRQHGGCIDGIRVAIPERSFKPLRVTTETKTRTRIEAAG
mgnify:CR=1 FL=1